MPKTPFKPAFGSPVGKQSSPGPSSAMDGARRSSQAELKTSSNGAFTNANQGSGGEESNPKPTRLRELFPSFSTSKYARAQRSKIQLPPGVRKPGQWIKDSGPVQVEPKVWLANQRCAWPSTSMVNNVLTGKQDIRQVAAYHSATCDLGPQPVQQCGSIQSDCKDIRHNLHHRSRVHGTLGLVDLHRSLSHD